MENADSGLVLQMRDGWSDYHRARFEHEVERLEKKLAVLKHEIAKIDALPSGHKRCRTLQNAAEEKQTLA